MQAGFFILGIALLITSAALGVLVGVFAFPLYELAEPRIWQRLHHFIRYSISDPRLRPAYLAVRYLAFTGIVWVASSLILGMITEQMRQWQLMNDLLRSVIIFSPPLLFSMLIHEKRSR